MKNTIALLLSVVTLANCQESHPAKFTICLKDDSGVPISNYMVHTGTYDKAVSDEKGEATWAGPAKPTGTDGRVIFEMPSVTGMVGINFFQGLSAKYYLTRISNYQFQRVENGRWVPENPLIEVVLKRKLNPIPMYASKVGSWDKVEVPGLDREYGFDLVESDWVAPYGKGKVADFVFRLEQRYVSIMDFDGSLTVKFSNKGDGLIKAPQPRQLGSELKLNYHAPSDGYVPDLVFKMSSTPPIAASNPDMNYYFRIRTVLDKDGKVKSALYGKIHGDIRFDHTEDRQIFFSYYLNPTPNDRNVEFDPKRNLLQGADRDTAVCEP